MAWQAQDYDYYFRSNKNGETNDRLFDSVQASIWNLEHGTSHRTRERSTYIKVRYGMDSHPDYPNLNHGGGSRFSTPTDSKAQAAT